MGQLWHDPYAAGEVSVQKVSVRARRTLLCALVLNALLWMLCTFLGRGGFTKSWAYLGLWSLFAWSIVVTVYAVRTYMVVRRYGKGGAAGPGMTDLLTGLPSRQGLLSALEGYDLSVEELGKRARLIDVDLINLEKVNYEFGRMVGDAVLQDIADLLRQKVPEQDLVGRLGGDEFLIIMPQATVSEADELAAALGKSIAGYRLGLGERGEVHGIKANVSVSAYVPEQASLHETVVSAKEATAHGRLPQMAGEGQTYYHVPRVTLGAFAVHRWEGLDKKERDHFKLWQREPEEALTARMSSDIAHLLDERAERHWVDYVTAVPRPGGRASATRRLAEAVARHLGVPYRDVMRADTSGPETRTVEPAVDAVIDKGDGILLVSDVISSGILERRCVKKLSAAGAYVQVAAWSAY